MSANAITISINVTGARETLAAFRRLPKDASVALRDASLKLADALAIKVRDAARSSDAQSALMADTVKAVKDRIPVIQAGGTKRVGRNRAEAFRILFGSEFGASGRYGWYRASKYSGSRGRQYRRHLGKGSYWMFKTIDASSAQIGEAWSRAADRVIAQFVAGG